MAPGDLWRFLHGCVAAALVFAFAAAPGLDLLICADDAPAAAEAGFGDAATNIGAATDEPDHRDADACHHGHCHHGGGFAPPDAISAGGPGLQRPSHRLLLVAGRPSDMQFGLIRPPRG